MPEKKTNESANIVAASSVEKNARVTCRFLASAFMGVSNQRQADPARLSAQVAGRWGHIK